MIKLLILLFALIPVLAYGEEIKNNVTNLSCENHEDTNKKDFLSVCHVYMTIPKFVNIKDYYCFGEITVIDKMDKGNVTFNYGFLESYHLEKEETHLTPIFITAQIIFPWRWQVLSAKNSWVKCEKM